jgi:hypothetical protein
MAFGRDFLAALLLWTLLLLTSEAQTGEHLPDLLAFGDCFHAQNFRVLSFKIRNGTQRISPRPRPTYSSLRGTKLAAGDHGSIL